jgi:hypothetical protein
LRPWLPGSLQILAITAGIAIGSIVFAIVAEAGPADRAIEKIRAAQRTQFSDAEIIDGFLKTTLGSELQRGETAYRIRKYEGPVRVFIDNRGRPDRSRQAAHIVLDIARKIEHIDLALTADRSEAKVVITLVAERAFAQTLRKYFGAEQARKIQRKLEPQCLAGFAKDESFRIKRSDVILVSDVTDFIFYDCGYEEILQSLGPINDNDTVLWSMFNDDVSLGYFGIYDQLLLNLLYHPRIKAGMTRDEAMAVLPEILLEVRAFVARSNPPAP